MSIQIRPSPCQLCGAHPDHLAGMTEERDICAKLAMERGDDLNRVKLEALEQATRAQNLELAFEETRRALEHAQDELATAQVLLAGSVPVQALDALVDSWRSAGVGDEYAGVQRCREELTALTVEYALGAKVPAEGVSASGPRHEVVLDAHNFVKRRLTDRIPESVKHAANALGCIPGITLRSDGIVHLWMSREGATGTANTYAREDEYERDPERAWAACLMWARAPKGE